MIRKCKYNFGHDDCPNRMKYNGDCLAPCPKKLQDRIAELEAEVERLDDRDGKATIQLSYETNDYPFNFDDCKIVDFGVSDNIYVVKSPYLAKMRKVIDIDKEALERKEVQLAEAKAALDWLAGETATLMQKADQYARVPDRATHKDYWLAVAHDKAKDTKKGAANAVQL